MAMAKKTREQPITNVREEIAALRQEIARLNRHRFIRIHNSTPKLVWFQFLRGLAFGLGSVLGATVLVSVAVFMLSKIDFVPVIGDWARLIVDEIRVEPEDVSTYGNPHER